MKINAAEVGIVGTNCYIVSDFRKDKECVMVIDPGDNLDKIRSFLPSDVTHIVLTHAHFDHIGALKELHQAFPDAGIYAHKTENTDKEEILAVIRKTLGKFADKTHFVRDGLYDIPQPDVRLDDGDSILGFKVIHTPGHTKGSICLYSEEEKVLFSGDTLFSNGYGRCDLGGNEDDIFISLKKIMTLDDGITVYPGHGKSCLIKEARQALAGLIQRLPFSF